MKKEMSNEFIGFYKIMIPLIDSNLNNQYHPIYFTPKTKFPKYQYKYYQMKGYHISDEFLSNKIIETLQMHAILLQSTSEKEFFPIFRLMTTKEFDHTFEFFSKNTDLNNYYYTLGMINEKKLNFVKAREFFEKGCQQSEMFSLLKMVRILSEPFLAGKFQTKANYEHALDLTLQNFFNNGLFDCFTPNSESFYGIYLLYLYLDCFPEMVTVSLKTSLKNPLLKLLMSENWKKAEIYTLLQEIEIQYSEKSLLLGDLYHPKILGVNIETEFNKMQDKYTKGLRNNNKSWLKVACLNENFLNFELKRQSKVKANHILDDSINRINKNIETAYKRLESFPEYGCNFELLQYQASNFNKKALEISHLEYYRNLTQFGDESILRVFFKVLKFQMKKVDQIIMKEELTNELFMIAMKIYQTDNDFKEAPLAFCLEKGLGVKKNFPAAFNLYKDILKKIITSGFEIHFFCYRFASLLKASGYSDLEEYSTFFFQVSYWSLISSINEEDFNGFYELGKMYLKGRGIDANEGYSIKIYEALLRNVKEKKRDSLNDHILIQLLSKKIGKLKKTGPSALKNTSESDTLKELISKEKHNSNKTIKNWPIYKSLSSGGSITSEILNTLNVLNEKFKTLKIVNTEEWSSKVSFPFSKAFIQIKGSIKSKEMIKDNEEPPKWRSSMKNSLKYKIEDFTAYIKDCLSNYLHCFELHEFQLNLHEKKIIGNHILHPAKIKCNSQIFSVQILELGDLTLSQEKILLLLEKLEPYIKISSPYFLNIIGFSLILNPKAQIYIFYENFSETLTDFIDQQDSSPPISSKYFFWLLFIVQTFQNSGYLFSYLTEANFILTKTLIPKLVDLDYEILNRQIKQTMTIETSRANTFFNLAKGSIPPEILYGVMKNNKSTLSIGSVAWSLGIIGFGLFSKKQLFEGVEIKNYDDFKTFFNQEKIEAKLESFLNGEEILKVLKVLLNMNQQDRTNINLQEIWSQNPQGNQVEFPDENYLIINGFLHVNFDKADSADQEIYLPHKEYFRGECQSNLPNGKCQFNSGNFKNNLCIFYF